MKALKYTFVALALVATLVTTSCANSDDVSVPEIKYHQATPTITLDELYAKANTTLQQYTENDVLKLTWHRAMQAEHSINRYRCKI